MAQTFLTQAQGISQRKPNKMTVILGTPGSGKTYMIGSYPKPLLLVMIGADGGEVVLSDMNDDDVKVISLTAEPVTDAKGRVQTTRQGKVITAPIYPKLFALLNELKTTEHGFKTVAIDAVSSIPEDFERSLELQKGANLNFDERSAILSVMIDLRDQIIALAHPESSTEYVLLSHIKQNTEQDSVSSDKNIKYIPKMSKQAASILLERANNVMYQCRRSLLNPKTNTFEVKFLTYIGAHPNIDTKFRIGGGLKDVGIYIENCTYDKLEKLRQGETVEHVNVEDEFSELAGLDEQSSPETTSEPSQKQQPQTQKQETETPKKETQTKTTKNPFSQSTGW